MKNVPSTICTDSRKADRKKGLINDMTVDFVRGLIGDGCSYCGESELRMTLDRIDNAVGHVTTNVVPACIRCNYMRRDMPHSAWLVLCPSVREARESGAFGNWTGSWQKTREAPDGDGATLTR